MLIRGRGGACAAFVSMLALLSACGGGGESDVGTPGAEPGADAAAGAAPRDASGTTAAASGKLAVGAAIRPSDDLDMDRRARALVHRYADAADADPADPVPRYQVAMALQANGADEAARRAWDQVLRMQPEDAASWYHSARLRRARGDLPGAVADLTRAVELAPDRPAPVARRGLWRIDLGELPMAEADLLRAVELEPGFRPARLGLARLWIQQGRHEAALAEILVPMRNAGEATPHARFLLGRALSRLGRDEEAAIELEAGAGSSITWDDDDPWVLEQQRYWVGEQADLARARALIEAGRSDEAIPVLEPLVVDPARDAAARVLLGTALRESGDLARATTVLADGLEALPGEAPLALALAEARLADGDDDAALRLARRAVDASPRLAAAHAMVARIHHGRGEWQAAEAAARRALEIEPTHFSANLHLGLAIDRQPQRRREAFAQLQLTRRRHPGRWEPYVHLGAILGSAGQVEDAMRFAREAGRLSPGNPRVAELVRLIQQRAARGPGGAP